ncbi:MAG TPA: ATP-binding protein [Terracidiphilus sp.]|nr:ATP-binding protein [Terracidiphilus sp.]
MIRLIVKIFLAYWLAAGLVIVAVNIRPHQHMHIPELTDALYASLDHDALLALQSYRAHGCTSDFGQADPSTSLIGLAKADGTILCGNFALRAMQSAVTSAAHSGRIAVSSYRDFQVVAFPMPEDKSLVFLLLSRYRSPLQFYGTLPGNITFEVSLVVTVVMALLVALPIKRLRAMAHEIGLGNLDARVSNGFLTKYVPFLGAGDDLDGLAIDFNFMAGRIEALVNAQRLLLRDVSHELRSPLARANLALELAKAKSCESACAYLDRIELETGKLNDLISQLMDLSYMEMINGLAHPEEFALSLIVLDLLPDLQFEAAAKGCHVVATVAQACRARGDRNLLHRALENVARNAIRYTPSGGSVTIRLDAEERSGAKQAVLKVSDSGPGVPEGELHAIVKPFYRVDQSRQAGSGGFGIGLAIADRTIQLHNGELRVSNGSRGGLVVEMRIPAIALEA